MRNFAPVGLILHFLCIACTTAPKTAEIRKRLSFQYASTIISRQANEKQILEDLGSPDKTKTDSGKYRWTYLDPVTKFQRVVVTFDSAKNIESILWTPSDENEANLASVLRKYPDGLIKKVSTRHLSPHNFSTESTYSDGKSITILHNDAAQQIEAIAWYSEVRKPAVAK